jgi:hypothetical protein
LFSKIMTTMWEKSGTSGRGTGVGSSVGAGLDASTVTTGEVDEGRGCGAEGKGEGVDPVKVGRQAEARKEAQTVIHKRRVINFISDSFSQIIRVKSRCIENATNKCCL